MEQQVYHVMLDGKQVGPYDRRTIVGMRIKNTLVGDNVLIAGDGRQLTVRELISQRAPSGAFNPDKSGSFSIVKATYTASLVALQGKGLDIPAFKGEMEARVQADVLRLAGRFRQGVAWKEDRVKVPLKDVVHARVRNTEVDLWLRTDGKHLQQLTLELFSPEAAGEFVDWLPAATLPPEPARRQGGGLFGQSSHLLWVAAVGVVVAFGVVLVVLLAGRRLY